MGRYDREIKMLYDRRYYQENKATKDDKTKLYWKLHPEKKKEYTKKHKILTKLAAFEHYGFACACCGEVEFEFLCIDHINGGGNKHRKEIKGSSIYSWLKKNHYPEGFRVLCFNCNMAHGFFGYCPHSLTYATDPAFREAIGVE